MSISRLKRVLWRLKELYKNPVVTKDQLDEAILVECGTDPRTLENNIRVLIKLGMIKDLGGEQYECNHKYTDTSF